MTSPELLWAEEHYRLTVAAHDRAVNLYLDSVDAVRQAHQHLEQQRKDE